MSGRRRTSSTLKRRGRKMNNDVLIICGSPRKHSFSTAIAEKAAENILLSGNTYEKVMLKDLKIGPCTGCDGCRRKERDECIIDDDMKILYSKIKEYANIILACPIYWFSVNSIMKTFIDRLYGLHTEKTKILEHKKFGIILVYGDDNVVSSGVANAIRMFEDSFRYTRSKMMGIIHRTETDNHVIDEDLENEINDLVGKMRTT